MAKGRTRKAGKRTPSGQLSRKGLPTRDKGTDWVQRRREKFGEHYGSALGRAYASGLLGDGQIALDRLQAGKRFARLYSAHLEQGRYRCPLAQEQRLLDAAGEPDGTWAALERQEIDMAEIDWLLRKSTALEQAGLRSWLDQLIGEAWTDHGPAWLDRMTDGGRHFGDVAVLEVAIRALDLIAPKRQALGILVAA